MDASRLLHDITLGLDAIHSQQMVHRDIKPDNLLLHKGKVVICDLGLCRNLEQGLYRSKKGYFYYISPEARKSGLFSTPSDIWSLGCVIITMLSGKSMEERKASFFKMSQKNIVDIIDKDIALYSQEFTQLTKSCLTIKTESRPTTKDILCALSKIMNTTEKKTPTSSESPCTMANCSCTAFIADRYVPFYCYSCLHESKNHEESRVSVIC